MSPYAGLAHIEPFDYKYPVMIAAASQEYRPGCHGRSSVSGNERRQPSSSWNRTAIASRLPAVVTAYRRAEAWNSLAFSTGRT